MHSTKTLLPLALLAAVHATPCQPQKIQWGPCEEGEFNTTLPMECGTIKVPLDYSQPNSTATLDLAILKIPAQVQPSKGSIFHNFGGPGATARGTLLELGPILQYLSGHQFDLLAFDPRGTGKNLPFHCTTDQFNRGTLANEIGLLGNASEVALARQWARGAADANICFETAKETGALIGTAFVARDLISAVDALGEDGMLRYWGFSYGTTLGATVAAMFPERIDRLVIDGVSNVHQYYHAHADFEEWTDTDKALSNIFIECAAAGPERCDLAKTYNTAEEMEQAVWDLLERLKYSPFTIASTVIDYALLKGLLVFTIKQTELWQSVASVLNSFLTDDLATISAFLASFSGFGSGASSFDIVESLMGIHCSDRIVRASTYEEIEPAFNQLLGSSRLIGDVVTYLTAHCAQWKFHAKEQYAGDFRVKTKNPILLVSNVIDGHTPLRSAHNVSASFEGSAVLAVNGTGHCSISVPSVCTVKQTAAYWVNGTLPEEGFVCPGDAPAYSGLGWNDIFAKISGNVTITPKKREAHQCPSFEGLGRTWML